GLGARTPGGLPDTCPTSMAPPFPTGPRHLGRRKRMARSSGCSARTWVTLLCQDIGNSLTWNPDDHRDAVEGAVCDGCARGICDEGGAAERESRGAVPGVWNQPKDWI